MPYRDSLIVNLPYGVRKVVEMARALCTEPRLLLLDEPSSGLSVEETEDMAFWIQDIRELLGITVLMVEHDMSLVSAVSDRVLALNYGRPIALGTAREVQEHPEVDQGVPGRLRDGRRRSSPCRMSRPRTARSWPSAGSASRCRPAPSSPSSAPTAAGKTTILKTVSGVMDPQKGTVVFDGREIQRMDPDRVVRLGLSHVPEGREVFPFLSVRENLRMGAYTRTDADGVARDLEMVYEYFPVLRARAEQRAGALSGGEQQMLAISRALMARPKMMLLDEPSLGLAPKLVKEIFEIILRINREQGVTVLLVEQNANIALHTADYGYVLEVGRIVMEDTCARLLEKEDIKEFYLGMKERASGARGAGSGRRRGDERRHWEVGAVPRRHVAEEW